MGEYQPLDRTGRQNRTYGIDIYVSCFRDADIAGFLADNLREITAIMPQISGENFAQNEVYTFVSLLYNIISLCGIALKTRMWYI